MADFSISEAAELLGATTKALRHWEELGLLAPARTSAGYRLYSQADIERGAAIALYRGVGVPLSDIAQLLDASPSPTPSPATRKRLLLDAMPSSPRSTPSTV